MKKYSLFFFLFLLGEIVFSQPVRVVPQEISGRETNNALFEPTLIKSYRLEASNLQVPFFDNFNYSSPSAYYNNWDSSGVDIATLIDGPAAYGVRFNGLKSNKTKYSTDTLKRVKTDTLISKPFNATSISTTQPATVDFIWQGGGLGVNQPDSALGDLLVFSAKGSNGLWMSIWSAPAAKNYSKTKYYKVSIPLTDPQLAYDGLTFRFENTGLPSVKAAPYFITNFEINISGAIPFWDDFSNLNAARTHFKSNTGVYINNQLAINQPSVNVASFDGLDNNGKTYFKSSVVEMGEADSLVSWPINLEPYSRKDSLRFSFYYQKGGYGETPDLSEGDSLVLLLYTKSGIWKSFWHSNFKETVDSSKFYQVLLTIKDSSIFHKDFKFKFFNYSRLSGSFDLWNLDYITLDTLRRGRDTLAIENKALLYSDLAISKSPSTIFSPYNSVPAHHLGKLDSTYLAAQNNFSVSALTGPLNITSHIKYYFNNILLNDSEIPNLDTVELGITQINFITKSVVKNLFIPLIQSNIKPNQEETLPFTIKIQASFNKDPTLTNSVRYPFWSNDTATSTFTFDNYYAYDDGTYEFGEMLEQDKASQAMRFNLYQDDTLTDIDFSIPYIGYRIEKSVFFLKVWADDNGKPGKVLYSKPELAAYSTGIQPFTRYKIKDMIKLSGTFYIGYQQINGFSRSIRLGYDANTEHQDKLFYDNNRGYGWSQVRNLKGTLMIRPVFRDKAINTQKRVDTEFRMEMRPNPCTDILYFNGDDDVFEWIDIYHTSGNRVRLEYNTNKVDVSNLMPGIYIVKAFKDNKIFTEKLSITSN